MDRLRVSCALALCLTAVTAAGLSVSPSLAPGVNAGGGSVPQTQAF